MKDPKRPEAEAPDSAPRIPEYEAPRLTSLGNARDLLAGNAGSLDDAPCGFNPTKHS
jgi:hypothetical protein